MLALGIIIPVLPKLVTNFLGGDTAKGAQVYGIFGTIWALMHFLCSPLLGALSDHFGRRPVILLSNIGLGLDYFLMALAPTIGWLFIGRMISGITAASIPTAYAYIADTTQPEKRAASFGLLGAAFGVGFILGPALGGLLGSVDPRLPFWVAGALSLVNALYGVFILPESLSKENRAPFRWKKANPIGSLTLIKEHAHLPQYATVQFLSTLAHVVFPSTYVLYAAYRYGWDEKIVGLTLACVGLCSGIVQGVLVGPTVKRLGEHKTLQLSLIAGIAGFLILGFAANPILFALSIPFTSLWGMSGPAIQGIMTKSVTATEQGKLQGANGSILGIAELLGPAIFTLTFSFFISHKEVVYLPGAAFVLSAIFLFFALVVARKKKTA